MFKQLMLFVIPHSSAVGSFIERKPRASVRFLRDILIDAWKILTF